MAKCRIGTAKFFTLLLLLYRTLAKIQGFYEYVVPPLEGFWWQDHVDGVDYSNKSTFNWISVIRLPDFVSAADFKWAVQTATKKKKLDCSAAEFITIDEGLCVQIMHAGPFDDEPETVATMDAYLEQTGYVNDSAKADYTMRFICPMQERSLPISGEQLSDTPSKKYKETSLP